MFGIFLITSFYLWNVLLKLVSVYIMPKLCFYPFNKQIRNYPKSFKRYTTNISILRLCFISNIYVKMLYILDKMNWITFEYLFDDDLAGWMDLQTPCSTSQIKFCGQQCHPRLSQIKRIRKKWNLNIFIILPIIREKKI